MKKESAKTIVIALLSVIFLVFHSIDIFETPGVKPYKYNETFIRKIVLDKTGKISYIIQSKLDGVKKLNAKSFVY